MCERDIYFNCLIEMISLLAEHSLVINDDFTAVLIRDFPSVQFITRIFIPSPVLWKMTEKTVFMLSFITLPQNAAYEQRSS